MSFYLVALLFLGVSTMVSLVSSDYQGDALLELRSSLNASSDQLSSWNTLLEAPCPWENVVCDSDRTFSGMGLSGSLSPSIAVLKSLKTLDLTDNKITGEIPMEFGNLSSLLSLYLENNHLTGKIPSSLGNLRMLKYLDLSHNHLNGSIPESVANLPNLTVLELASNGLSGRIPDRLFQIPKYNYSDNNFNCGESFPHFCASNPSYERSSNKTNIGAIIGIIAAVSFLLGVVLCMPRKYIIKAREHETFVDVAGEFDEVDRGIECGQLKRFLWRELELATGNFSERNVLGVGGFGKVYKGVLADSTKVAVKRLLNCQKPGIEKHFLHEVKLIGAAFHRHIIQLIGFCTTPSELLLVYPYMENLES